MRPALSRRDFLTGAAAAATLVAAGCASAPRPTAHTGGPRQIRKAIMWGTVGVKGSIADKMKAVRAAGFEGVEMMSHMNVAEVLRARDETGLAIPSVCGEKHWSKPLTDPDPAVRAEGLEGLKQCLRDAKAYGASSVLLVPGVVNGQVSYADAYARSQAEIRKAIPLAEQLGVKIAIENVWNNFLLSPLEAARFVDEFRSPLVGWHFDVGNVINYGWPEQWIRVLGPRILKLHIKEFSRTKADKEGRWAGFNAALLEGENNWPAVMRAVDEIGYRGWAITEQGGGGTPEGLKDLADRLGKILAL
jgi:hexulose-6-phosphate isomerase